MQRNSSLPRLLLCALLAVLVCAAPLGGLAEPVPTPPVIGTDHPTEAGEVMLFKEAKPVPGMVNTWDITVRIEAWDKPVTSDIILVIDRSGSMADTRIASAKSAANAFVDTLLDGTHRGVRIGVASFAGDASIDQSLTDNAAALKDTINMTCPPILVPVRELVEI